MASILASFGIQAFSCIPLLYVGLILYTLWVLSTNSYEWVQQWVAPEN